MLCVNAKNIVGKITGQRLEMLQPLIVGDTINYLTAKYELSDEWTGADIFAFFRRGETVGSILLTEDGEITENQHLNLSAGRWETWLIGEITDGGNVVKRITTQIAEIRVERSGVVSGEPFPDDTGSAGEQVVAQAIAARDRAEEAAEAAMAAETVAVYKAAEAGENAAEAAASAEEAAASAEEAAESVSDAENARDAAEAAADSAWLAVEAAESAADNAGAAAENAAASAQEIEDLTVSAHGITAGSTPTVTKTGGSGGTPYNLDFGIPPGTSGRGITSITLLSTVGLVDTYRITFTDGTYTDYSIENGKDGEDASADVTDKLDHRIDVLETAAEDTILDTRALSGSERVRTLASDVMPFGRIRSAGGYSYIPDGEQEIISASPAQIISRDADDVTLATADLSALVAQYFPGGMHSAGTVHDELDLENKKAIRRIAVVDMGTMNWWKGTATGYTFFFAPTIGGKSEGEALLIYPVIAHRFNQITTDKSSATYYAGEYDTPARIAIRDDAKADMTIAQFKEAMDGVMLYYELAEPVITDITEDVESLAWLTLAPGGSITVTTSLDAEGITVSVPSEIETFAKLTPGGGADLPETTSILKGDGEGGAEAATPGTDYVTPAGLTAALADKQDILTPGYGISIAADGTISVSLPDGDGVSY